LFDEHLRMRIRGIDHLSLEELDGALTAGGRLVCFEYCISLLFITLRRPTDIYLVRGHELGVWRGLPFSLISLLLGWWGIPWGVIYTPFTILTNLRGGFDVTAQVRPLLESAARDPTA
jgi:hypothetical protein